MLPTTTNSGGASNPSALKAILRSLGHGAAGDEFAPPNRGLWAADYAGQAAPAKYGGASRSLADRFVRDEAQVTKHKLEMNKLLKCSYSGISNLFWCDATTSAA